MDNTNATVEIDIILLLKKLWSRKFLILLFSLLFATIAMVINIFLLTPSYTSTTSIYVVNKHSANESITTQDLQAGTYLVRDYKEIITSKDVLTTVIQREGLTSSTNALRSKISVTIPTDTRIIYITVQDDQPEEAAGLANAVREVASEKIKQVTKVDEVNVVEIAEAPTAPSSPRIRRNTILGALVGGFLAVVSILLTEILDDRVKRPEDVEEVMGMTLLGIVPDISQLK